MIHNLKPYPTYKDSGVPWLGKIPVHWNVLPNRALFDEVKERDCADEQLLSVTISKGVIRQSDLLTNSSKKDSSNEDKTNYKLVRPGDITYNKMRAWQGAVGVSKYRGIVSPAYVVVHPRGKQNANYFHYLLRTPDFAKEAERWSYGITSDQWSLRPEHFKMIYCSLPPEDEQFAIVRYFDHTDRRIRRYIRSKQKLIKLLEEQKQAIIHQSVTCGLDPNVKLKPSGVEWLGDVPEHWNITQIQALGRVVRGSSPRPAGSPVYFHGNGKPWITVGEITKDSDIYLYSTSTRLTQEGTLHSRSIDIGTLLLTNSGATLGIPKISCIKGCINDGVAAFLNLRSDVNKEYLYFYWARQTIHLKAWVDLGAQPNLNTQIIGGWPVLVPPIEEQNQIVNYVKLETGLISKAIKEAESEISLLHEYRKRLIADVVTGKLDVREEAANLPEESQATETFEDTISEDNGLDNDEIEDDQTGELEKEVLA